MAYNNEEYLSPYWAGFRRVWWLVAIILFLFLLITWLMGYGPGGKSCQVPVEVRTVEKLVTAPDIAAPLIALNGSSVMHVMTGADFIDPAARGTDGVDGNVTVTTEGDVDVNIPGEYIITYSVTDAAGNTATETRKVIVSDAADITAPVIALNGDVIVYLKTGEVYNEEGVAATDVDDDDDNITITTEGTVDTGMAGENVITYTATDAAGNSTTVTRKIVVVDPDRDAPIISLNDSSVLYLTTGEIYNEAGAMAVDANDGDLTITTEGTVDTSIAGEYIITYHVTDSAGNTATKDRKVVVTAAVVATSPEPEVIPEPAPKAALYFALDDDKKPLDSNRSFAAIVSYMKENSGAKAILSGFHDPSGERSYNQALANRRANAVAATLRSVGISDDRIILEKPIETTGTGAPAEARRVEITLRF